MGCSASFHHRGTTKNRSPISVSLGLKHLSVPLSRKTKITLKESWKLVEPVKSEAGKAMFMRYRKVILLLSINFSVIYSFIYLFITVLCQDLEPGKGYATKREG